MVSAILSQLAGVFMFKLFLTFALCVSHLVLASSPIVIGIAGGTGSGKTTLAQKIQAALGSDAVLIEQDCYYKDLSHLSFDERKKTNFDHPDSLDFERLGQDILALKTGHAIEKSIYNFKIHARDKGATHIESVPVIIVEGILIFNQENIRDLLDIKIFVETADDVRILRRAKRDIDERGRDLANVQEQYLTTVKPMHNQFVEPSKQFADVIIPGEKDNTIALKLLLAGILEKIVN
jgi:uridine kinase